MEVTVFNPVQQHLLKFFAFDGSEEKLLEMKAVLTKYFSQNWTNVWMSYGIREVSIRRSLTS